MFRLCLRRVSVSVSIVFPVLISLTTIYASPRVEVYYSLHHDSAVWLNAFKTKQGATMRPCVHRFERGRATIRGTFAPIGVPMVD